MGLVGGQELVIILVIVVLLFGAKKIPELAKGLGNGIREFKKATKDTEKQLKGEDEQVREGSEKGS